MHKNGLRTRPRRDCREDRCWPNARAGDRRSSVRPDGYVRVCSLAVSQLSAARWQRWSVFARSAAAVVSERWAGPNVGPSVARIPRVSLSLSPLARTLSLSFFVSLSVSRARFYATSPRARRSEIESQRPRFGNESSEPTTRRVSVNDVTQQPTRSEPRRKGRRRRRRGLRGRSQQSRSITLLDRGAARGRPIVLTNLPHRFRNDERRRTTKDNTKVKFRLRTTGGGRERKKRRLQRWGRARVCKPTPESRRKRAIDRYGTLRGGCHRGVETSERRGTPSPPSATHPTRVLVYVVVYLSDRSVVSRKVQSAVHTYHRVDVANKANVAFGAATAATDVTRPLLATR